MGKRRTKGTGSIFLRGKQYYMAYQTPYGRQREKCNTEDKDTALARLAEKLGEIAAGRVEPAKATVADLCRLVVEDYELKRLRSLKDVKWRVEGHIKKLLGGILAARLGSEGIRRYIGTRRKEGASDATINREMAILRRGYVLGSQQEPPLVHRRPYIPMLEEDNARQGFLEPESLDLLIAELPERLKALAVCAYQTGCRKNELRRLQWNQIDWQARQIRLTVGQTKGKAARTIPFSGDMQTWLERQRDSCPEGCPWVFHYRGGMVGNHLDGWTEACTRAGFPGLLFHDLRRSAVRNMKRADVGDKQAMAISGHKTRSVFDRYNIVDSADLDTAAAKLDEYLKARKEKPKLQVVQGGKK